MNGRHRSSLAAVFFVPLAIMMSRDARAEVFTDVFIGAAITADERYILNGFPVPPGLFCIQQCSSSASPVGGLRVGYFFEFERVTWLGVAGDISAFVPAWGIQSPIQVNALPVSLVAIFRLQLAKTKELPDGRVQPYIAIGPTLMTTSATRTMGSDNPIFTPTLGSLETFTDTSFDVGVDGRIGVRILSSDFISIFIEYRYTRVTPSWSLGTRASPNEFSTTLSTSYLTLGMGLHFR